MYNKKDNSKYRELICFVKEENGSEKQKEFEDLLKKIDEKYKKRFKIQLYPVYKMNIIENKTFKEIRTKLNLYDNHQIIKILDIVFMIYNAHFGI